MRCVLFSLMKQNKSFYFCITMNAKQISAAHAVNFVKSGMTVGLGTGSTAAFAIEALGNKLKQGLVIKAVASSVRSEELAQQAGITLIPFSKVETIDITLMALMKLIRN